jgi:predicted MFS family arabinose efflux permease
MRSASAVRRKNAAPYPNVGAGARGTLERVFRTAVSRLSGIGSALGNLRHGGRERTLLAVAFGWFLSISVRMIYPALLPYLREAYGLTLTTAGMLLTVLWLAYGFGQLPGGILADHVGERRLLIVSSFVAAGTLTLVVVAESAVILFGSTVLFGLGTALYGVSRFTILVDIYPDQLGTATGVTLAAGDIGNAVMPPIAGAVATVVAWQYGFGFAVPLFVLAGVGLWRTLPTGTSGASEDGSGGGSFDDVVSTLFRRVTIDSFVLLVLWAVTMQALIGFYPTYLIDVKEVPTRMATVLYGGFFGLGAIVKLLGGRAYDRVGVRSPLAAMMGVSAVGLAAFPFLTSTWAIAGVTVLISAVLGYETVVLSNLTNELPDETQGTGLGALRTIYIMLGALSPVAFGALADRGYFDEAFFGLAAICAFTVVVVAVFIDY